MKNREIYYQDELNDEFSGIKRVKPNIDDKFIYIHKNPCWKFLGFIVYRIFLTPFAYFYLKFKFHAKFVNKKVLKPFKRKGYFIYGNHTNIPADAFIPNMLSFPQNCYVVVNSENVAVKGTRNIMMMLGALPIPDNFNGMKNFINAIEKRSVQKSMIMIYPEAHVWPYYTKIRPFKATSFRYPVQFSDPSFCFTTTYQKRKHSKKPKMVIYVDGPFYADNSIDEFKRKEDLRNQIYSKMVERSANSNCEYVKYIKKEG
jgi:hypothetical protein